MPKVFISHSKKNRRRAQKLAQALQNEGIGVWFDEWNVLVGYKLADQIYEGIRTCDYLVVILTKFSVKSRWVKEELDLAMIEEIESEGVKVIPLLYEKCDIPDALKSKVYADFSSFEKGVNQVMRLISRHDSQLNISSNRHSKEDVMASLLVPRKLQELIFYIGHLLEGKALSEVLEGLRGDISMLQLLASRFGVDKECYEWLEEFKGVFEAGKVALSSLDERGLEEGRRCIDLWKRGAVLFRGGLANKLPVIPRVAFEVGQDYQASRINVTMILAGEKKFSEDFWFEQSESLQKELSLSDFFHTIAASKTSFNKILEAFVQELLRHPDYLMLRQFVQRRCLSEGILAGFLSSVIIGMVPISETHVLRDGILWMSDEGSQFMNSAETVAEYLLSGFGAVHEANELLVIIPDAISGSDDSLRGHIFTKLVDFQQSWYALASNASDSFSRTSFCLGCLIGKTLILSSLEESYPLDLAYDAESILAELRMPSQLKKNVRELITQAVSGTLLQADSPLPLQILNEIADSFRTGESDLLVNT